ncbi:MAG: single-stranded-DNA-specific exonuclease RecJ, partial [Gammaproteobacteria bacterium]
MHAAKKIIRRTIDEGLRGQLPDIHPVLQRVYIARGVQSASDIKHELNALLPFESLKNIKQAAQYLAKALAAQKRILIIGDFDADGATSAVLAVTA